MNKDMMPAHWTEDGPYGTPVSLKPAPIAWISRSPTNGDILHWSKKKALEYSSDIYPLYGAPPKREWVSLDDWDTSRVIDSFRARHINHVKLETALRGAIKDVEQKIKEKNHG